MERFLRSSSSLQGVSSNSGRQCREQIFLRSRSEEKTVAGLLERRVTKRSGNRGPQSALLAGVKKICPGPPGCGANSPTLRCRPRLWTRHSLRPPPRLTKFALATLTASRRGKPAVLYAYDAKSGKGLWNSGTAIASSVTTSGIATGSAMIYLATAFTPSAFPRNASEVVNTRLLAPARSGRPFFLARYEANQRSVRCVSDVLTSGICSIVSMSFSSPPQPVQE